MDKDLEIARTKLELVKVGAAKAEQQFLILQRMSEIKRIEEAIKIQEGREEELRQSIEKQSQS